jgi:hypothetical protein
LSQTPSCPAHPQSRLRNLKPAPHHAGAPFFTDKTKLYLKDKRQTSQLRRVSALPHLPGGSVRQTPTP